jgi:hypothetical protein
MVVLQKESYLIGHSFKDDLPIKSLPPGPLLDLLPLLKVRLSAWQVSASPLDRGKRGYLLVIREPIAVAKLLMSDVPLKIVHTSPEALSLIRQSEIAYFNAVVFSKKSSVPRRAMLLTLNFL